MLGHLAKVRRKVRAIRARDTALDKRALVRAYVKTQLTFLFAVKVLRLRLRRARVMGYRVRFDDYATFAFLFEEIFADEQYRFEPSTGAPVLVDGGANIGIATLYFKAIAPRARIIAFEPDPRAAALLRRNIAANHLSDVQVLEAALGARDGTVELFADAPGSVLATTTPGAFEHATTVRAQRLSSALDGAVDLVKLDVEGAEADVLGEVADAGKLDLIRALVFEYSHHHPDPQRDALGRVLRLLEDNGFGYTLSAPYPPPLAPRTTQNVLVSAYRKP